MASFRNNSDTIYLMSGGYKGIYIFLTDINPKEGAVVLLEFKPAYYDVAILHISRYATVT